MAHALGVIHLVQGHGMIVEGKPSHIFGRLGLQVQGA